MVEGGGKTEERLESGPAFTPLDAAELLFAHTDKISEIFLSEPKIIPAELPSPEKPDPGY
ncbi:MAG: hypothetical protein PHX83_16520 [Acidobacteriia bacterium]|nr:hypothetical protein [Terriglobia bacterium]